MDILDNMLSFNDLEADYNDMGQTYFFSDEKLNAEGRIVAMQYYSINEWNVILIFFYLRALLHRCLLLSSA